MNTDFGQIRDSQFKLYINEQGSSAELPIDSANVADFVIMWDYSNILVQGYILYEDMFQHIELLPPGNGLHLKVKITDAFSVVFERTFRIINISKQMKGQSSKAVVKLEFVDEYYNMLVNTFVSKGFKDKSATEIIEEVLKDGEKLISTPLNLVNIKSENKIPEYVVKGSQSLLKEIRQIQSENNLIISQGRKTLLICPTDKLGTIAPDLTGTTVFSTNQTDENSPFFVRNFDVGSNNSFNHNLILPKCKTYQCDGKNITTQEHSDEESHKTIGLGSKLSVKEGTAGEAKIYPWRHDVFSSIYNTRILESSQIKIEVNGCFVHSLLQKVKFQSNSTVEKIRAKMPYVNGTYFITKIMDRLMGGRQFGQFITLGRIGIE